MRHLNTVVALAVLVAVGCGDSAPSDPAESEATFEEQVNNQGLDQVRTVLEQIVETGTVGVSALYGLDESLKNAGKPELAEDLNRLASLSGDKAKKLASDMLSKL